MKEVELITFVYQKIEMKPIPHYIIADNQDITRMGVIALLKELKAEVIQEASGYRELLELLRLHPCSVVVIDYSLFDFHSLPQLLNIKSGAAGSSWLLLTDEPEEQFLRRLLLADSTISVVTKQDSLDEIRQALQLVSAGSTYRCAYAESVMKEGVPAKRVADPLTPSEKNILREIALGKTTKEIAIEKNLSFHTVNAHRRNIYRKLGVNSLSEVTHYALQAGLADLMEYYI